VLCLTVVPLTPGKNPFAVNINNNNIIIINSIWLSVRLLRHGFAELVYIDTYLSMALQALRTLVAFSVS
jgi:hypothetical protein